MPLDPNIIMGIKPVQFQNPLDAASTALSMKQLAGRVQLQDQQLGDEQAARQAYQNNVMKGPDGNPTVNRQGVLSDLAKRNPMLAMQKAQEFQSQDLAAKEAKMKQLTDQNQIAKQILWQIPTGPNVSQDQKEAGWQQSLALAKQYGLPVDNLPPHHPGDDMVNNLRARALSAEEQLKQFNADREDQRKREEFSIRRDDNKIKREQLASNKQGQAMQQTIQTLESARGNPAASQAERDLYAANKFESLAGLYGDPNKLNPSQVQLAASEVGKIASGGVPTQHELAGLTPSSIPGTLAKAAETFVNRPVAANQGAFIKALSDYTASLKGDARKVIEDKYGRVIESQRARLGDDNYKTLKGQYMDRFKADDEAAADKAEKIQRLQELRAKARGG